MRRSKNPYSIENTMHDATQAEVLDFITKCITIFGWDQLHENEARRRRWTLTQTFQ